MTSDINLQQVINGALSKFGHGTVTPPPPPPPPPPDPGSGGGNATLGIPADGTYYIGWDNGPTTGGIARGSIAQGKLWTPDPPGISIYHDYSSASDARVDAGKLDTAINAGMIPSQSFKLDAYTPAQIVNGAADAAIDASAATCIARAPHPIWLCYFHEPEDNFTTSAQATDYRAAYRRIVTRFRARGVTNVAWQPIFQNPYTFGSSGRDWRWWHADWNGSGWYDDIMMDLFGADTYNPLPGATTNRGFAEMWDILRNKVELSGYPRWSYTMPEFGMSYRATPTPDWVAWCTEARDYAKAHNIKSFQYWDNSSDVGRYSFGSTYDTSGNKLNGWHVITKAASSWNG